MNLTMGEKIRILIKRKNITNAELAKRIVQSPTNFANKMKRDNFSEKELRQIAEVLDCEFECYFVGKDGNRI